MKEKPGKKIKDLKIFRLKETGIKRIRIKPTNDFIPFNKESNQTIVSRFEQQVEKNPQKIAIKTQLQSVTYKKLNEMSNRIALRIRQLSGDRKEGVALLIEYGLDIIVGILGVLKAGKYYIPLDSTSPTKRLVYMLMNSDARILLTNNLNNELAGNLVNETENDIQLVNLNTIDEKLAADNVNVKIPPEDTAYILYTSGSTGTPKGVAQSHLYVAHLIYSFTNSIYISPNDHITLLPPFSFSANVMDLFGALLNSATLHPMDIKNESISNLLHRIRTEKISIYHSVPTLFRYFGENITEDDDFPDLRLIYLAGEQLLKRDVELFKKSFPDNCLLVNGMGCTEFNICRQFFLNKSTEIETSLVPVGYPAPGAEILLLDEEGRTVGYNQLGEITVKSSFLPKGYWKEPDLTKRKFLPSSDNPYEQIYLTGDMGRMSPDGCLMHLGRKDFQVKIRGQRVEIAEVENVLSMVEGIGRCVVAACNEPSGENYLVAYYQREKEIERSTLVRILRELLPEYMIPSVYIRLDDLPQTSSGKIDRGALPKVDPCLARIPYVPPRNRDEELLVAIWSEVLKKEKETIGINDNFFELGGNSLRSIRLASKIHKELQVKFPLAEIFQYPSIREQSDFIKNVKMEKHASIQPAEEMEYHAVSSAQKRLYILQKMYPGGVLYNLPRVLVWDGDIDRAKFETAFNNLINRHESLRTSFEIIDVNPVQRIHYNVEFEIEYYDLTRDQVEAEDKVEDIIRDFIRPFDMAQAPLLRVGLIKKIDREHILMVDIHHIITDGTANLMLVRDFITLYKGEVLPELPLRYKDFSQWQNCAEQKETKKKQGEYWLKLFENEIPVLNLPTDFPRSSTQGFTGGKVNFRLGKKETDGLKKIAMTEGGTLYMVTLSIFAILLSKICGQEDIITGIPTAGRRHAELDNIIGFFINTLALKHFPRGDKKFPDFLQEVKERTLEAFENQDFQFEDLVENVNVNRDTNRNPLFDVMFELHNMETEVSEIPGVTIKPYSYDSQLSPFDLTLMARESPENLVFTLLYSVELFKRETAERFTRYFKNLVASILENAGKRISHMEIITVAEKEMLFRTFNDNKVDVSTDKIMYRWVEDYAGKSPHRVALQYNHSYVTYRQLSERSNRLARLLWANGLIPEQTVGIFLDRSPAMVECILAAWKAGGAYIPIAVGTPVQRIAGILKDSGTRFLFARQELIDARLEKSYSGRILQPDQVLAAVPAVTGPAPPVREIEDNSLAYVIYTSGSTGKPKGAMVEHAGMLNHIRAKITDLQITAASIVAQNSAHTFDISVWQFFAALTCGGRTSIYPDSLILEPGQFISHLAKDLVTILEVVPSYLAAVLDTIQTDGNTFATLRYLLVTGEEVKPNLVKRWFAAFPGIPMINAFGPTEASDDITHHLLDKALDRNQIPIGKPLRNFNIYIVDKNMNPCPIGVKGEIYVSGIGVGRGYLNDCEKTALAFTKDPFTDDKGRRLFKTGDLGAWLPDGTIDFFGRKDYQVKIRGFRIEPGEIESKLMAHEAVKEAVVINREGRGGNNHLCAYLTWKEKPRLQAIKKYLAGCLPGYMVPAHFVQLERMPLTPNGKLNRKLLQEMELKINTTEEYTPPETKYEKILAEIWQEELKTGKISVNDNFFELGGNSLKIIRVNAKLKKSLEIDIAVVKLFEYPSIRKLADYLKHLEKEGMNKNVSAATEDQEEFLNKMDDSLQDSLQLFEEI